MLRRYLRLHLLGPIGLTTAGVTVTLGGVDVLIFASLGYMIADLDGHRAGLDWKGANGYRPCLRHMNVLKKNSETAELDPTAGFVEITCADPARLGLARQPTYTMQPTASPLPMVVFRLGQRLQAG